MTDTRFTASNGFHIDDGWVRWPDGERWLESDSAAAAALVEYGAHKAQAERDAVLGRWRSVAYPDCIAYPSDAYPESLACIVFNEATGAAQYYSDVHFIKVDGVMDAVAAEYWAAHPVPEPKPWEQANTGELWSLLTGHSDAVYLAIPADDFGMEFVGLKDRFSADHTGITAGRRIWPEVSA